MKPKIYVDGQEGTTGLKIHEHLAQRSDVETLRIDPDKRKDPAERQKLLNAADLVFLCLPDAASREAVALITNAHTKVIDASTAFRTDPAWAYGLPELSAQHRQKIKTSTRVANPGCHASAFLLAVTPLVAAGIIKKDALLTACSLTGYSGGGKKMIAAYQSPTRPAHLAAPRPYALKLTHKHLPEMQHIAGLVHAPLFTPIVCDIYIGLCVETFLPPTALTKKMTAAEIHAALAAHYAHEKFIQVLPFDPEATFDQGAFDITACNNTNRADLAVVGHDDQIALLCRLDNLGKGASGAAIQCMNLALGFDEATGL
jgi:N-acetyl-gamma-glutamyl-phosphate reductase